MNESTNLSVAQKLVNEQLQRISDNKIHPLLAQIAQEHAKIRVAEENIANYKKQVASAMDEIGKVSETLGAVLGA